MRIVSFVLVCSLIIYEVLLINAVTEPFMYFTTNTIHLQAHITCWLHSCRTVIVIIQLHNYVLPGMYVLCHSITNNNVDCSGV